MEKLGTSSETDGLISLCASLCNVTEDVFDQISDIDFETIAGHVVGLLEKRAEKKSGDSTLKKRNRNRKSRATDAPGVRVHALRDS